MKRELSVKGIDLHSYPHLRPWPVATCFLQGFSLWDRATTSVVQEKIEPILLHITRNHLKWFGHLTTMTPGRLLGSDILGVSICEETLEQIKDMLKRLHLLSSFEKLWWSHLQKSWRIWLKRETSGYLFLDYQVFNKYFNNLANWPNCCFGLLNHSLILSTTSNFCLAMWSYQVTKRVTGIILQVNLGTWISWCNWSSLLFRNSPVLREPEHQSTDAQRQQSVTWQNSNITLGYPSSTWG